MLLKKDFDFLIFFPKDTLLIFKLLSFLETPRKLISSDSSEIKLLSYYISNLFVVKIIMINRSRRLLNLIKPLSFQCYFKFSSLPQGSKFTEELGLNEEFSKARLNAEKNEKNSVGTYEGLIAFSLSIIGFFLVSFFVIQENRGRVKLLYQTLKRKYSLSQDKQKINKEVAEMLLQHQNKFGKFGNRSQITRYVLRFFMKRQILNPVNLSSELVEKILVSFIPQYNSKLADKSEYLILLQKYFEFISLQKQSVNQNMMNLLEFLLLHGNPLQIYIAIKNIQQLDNLKAKSIQIPVLKRITHFREKNANNVDLLSKKDDQDFYQTGALKFQFQLEKKALEYSEQKIAQWKKQFN